MSGRKAFLIGLLGAACVGAAFAVASTDASRVLGLGDVLITRIVNVFDESLAPIVTPPQMCSALALPLSLTPLFVRRR